MEARKSPPVHEEFARLGWNPLDPSEECLSETRRPEMPSRFLDEIDRLGIHRKLVLVDIIVRFDNLVAPWTLEIQHAVQLIATLLAVRASGCDLKGLSQARYVKLCEDLLHWEETRLAESCKLIDRTAYEGARREPRSRYEPGMTLMDLTTQKGWVNVEADIRATRAAMLLAERRGARPKATKEIREYIAGLPIDENEVGELIRALLNVAPGRPLVRVKDGRLNLGATEVRDALAKDAGEIQRVCESFQEGHRVELGTERVAPALEPILDFEDELEGVLSILRVRQDEAEAGSIEALAIEYAQKRAHSDTPPSIREFALDHGVNRETLARHLRILRADTEKDRRRKRKTS